MRFFTLCMLLLALVGCSNQIDPGKTAEAVDVSGKLTANGKPVNNVCVVFVAIEKGQGTQANVTKNGEFKLKMVPGKYTFLIDEIEGDPASAKIADKIPQKYRTASPDRAFEVRAGTPIELKVDY